MLNGLDPASPTVAQEVAAIALRIVPDSAAPDPHWDISARQLVAGGLLYVLTLDPDRRSLATVRELFSAGDLDRLFSDMAASAAFDGELAHIGGHFLYMAPRERASIVDLARRSLDDRDAGG